MTLAVDTIAAIATAPGLGAISVVRMSGPEALEILRGLVAPDTPAPDPRVVTLVEVLDPADGSPVDRCLATYFEAPASYTGEDVVELSCHGGPLVPGLVLDACLRLGARRAEAGEFTKRAYLHGKLDLVQAEAVADLVEARSRALHDAALAQLDRGLSGRVTELRSKLLELEALLVHHIDFPEEDDAPAPVTEIATRATELLERFDALLRSAPEGELLRDGALTVLAGRPNAGKSSLYNALIGRERAIVTDLPGTTRDALEAVVQMEGFPFRLVDTAGLRESEEHVERIGVEVARRYLESADMVLLCVPIDEDLSADDVAFVSEEVKAPVLLLRTKADLATESSGDAPDGFVGVVGVSVESGEGLDELRRELASIVFTTLSVADREAPVLTRRRQSECVERAREEVAAFAEALRDGLPPEVASAHLKTAETALEELLGIISIDDVLDVVFRDFCVGK